MFNCTILILKEARSNNVYEVLEVNSVRISTQLILFSRMIAIMQVHWPQNPADHKNLPVYLMHIVGEGFDGLQPPQGKADELEQRIRETVLPFLLTFYADGQAFNRELNDDDIETVPRRSKKGKGKGLKGKGKGLKGSRDLKSLLDNSEPHRGEKDI